MTPPVALVLARSEDGPLTLLLWVGGILVYLLFQAIVSTRKRRRRYRRHQEKTGRPVKKKVVPGVLREFAEGMGFTTVPGRIPRVEGVLGGFPVSLDFVRLGMPRTRARVILPVRAPSRVTIRPGTTVEGKLMHRPTGDAAFDREYRVLCYAAGLAERAVTEEARTWLTALGTVEVEIKGAMVKAFIPGMEDDQDRLRGLAEAVVALARGVTGSPPSL